MKEAGVADYDASVWLALLAPAGTPRDVVLKLNAEIGKAMGSADTHRQLQDAGVEPASSTPEEMAAYMADEMARWGKVVRENGIKAE